MRDFTWLTQSYDIPATDRIVVSVAHNGTCYCALVNYQSNFRLHFYTSTNGVNWTKQDFELTTNVTFGIKVIVLDGIFIVNGRLHTYTSTDGVEWNSVSLPTGNSFIAGTMDIANSLLFRVIHTDSTGNDELFYSVGGLSPVFLSAGLIKANGLSVRMVVAYNGTVYCVARSTDCWFSSDLKKWLYHVNCINGGVDDCGMVGGNNSFVLGTDTYTVKYATGSLL